MKYIQKKYGLRVLYIDTDAHHGDGVQWSFYDDPNVCTISLHETGRYLFPGTGAVNERGQGNGYSYSLTFHSMLLQKTNRFRFLSNCRKRSGHIL